MEAEIGAAAAARPQPAARQSVPDGSGREGQRRGERAGARRPPTPSRRSRTGSWARRSASWSGSRRPSSPARASPSTRARRRGWSGAIASFIHRRPRVARLHARSCRRTW
ncbi:MAG: hypothetical protein M0C28_40760 [Candidatus Moduliflexus flocculans]|nr:hypothetical protein [Candidatus Moduliflexus flocculans]